jgi:hypothetical protein
MGADKNSPQITRPMSQSQLQKSHSNTNRQDNIVMDQLQVLGTIPQSTRGSTRKETKESNNLGKNLRTDQTVRLAVADCSAEMGRTVRKTGRGWSAVQKSPPTEKHCLCLNGPPNGPQPLADCPPAADCPPSTSEWSVNEQSRNPRTHKEHLPKVVIGSPKRLELLRQYLGEMIGVTR